MSLRERPHRTGSGFKGIPFAEPPVGKLRWKPPQPLKPWDGVKKTQAFGPSPTQNPALAVMMNVPGTFGEDCLYLNVWTPAKDAASACR